MIVPGTRLIAWVAALLPAIAVGTMVPGAWWVPLALYGALAVVAGADGLLARVGGVRVVPPDVVRMTRGRDGEIPLTIHNPGSLHRRMRISLPLPESFTSPDDPMEVLLPPGATTALARWASTPAERGRFRPGACCFELPSPLAFWGLRGRTECTTELRVYPNLAVERKSLAALFLDRGNYGSHARRWVGQGREFEKLREYVPGDGQEDIHWKATAKRGKPVTKVFQVERTQEVYCVLDTSRLSARLYGGEPVLERTVNAALTLALAAEKQGDLFGLVAFERTVERFVRAASGKAHFSACRDALYTVRPRMNSPDFAELATFIRLRLRRRALLIFFTDLADPVLAEDFQRDVARICGKHLVLVCMPARAEVAPLFAGAPAEDDDDVYARLAGHIAWRHLRELELSLRRQGVVMAHVSPARLSGEAVARYLDIKSRQLI